MTENIWKIQKLDWKTSGFILPVAPVGKYD